jgi:hypothetical protein
MKQHLNKFTEKIIKIIQESANSSSMNLQKLDSPLAEETLNEIKRVLFTVRDFE